MIAAPDGRVALNLTGNPGMATGGTGDVLTGVIAAWFAQLLDAEAASRLGVYLHGLAGDLSEADEGEHALIAGDLVAHLGDAVLELTARKRIPPRQPGRSEPPLPMSVETVTTRSEEETAAVAARLAAGLAPGSEVLLYGDLGAGKTAFVRGLAEGLGIDPDDVSSPTFTLIQRYDGPVTLWHVDLYRLRSRRRGEGARTGGTDGERRHLGGGVGRSSSTPSRRGRIEVWIARRRAGCPRDSR